MTGSFAGGDVPQGSQSAWALIRGREDWGKHIAAISSEDCNMPSVAWLDICNPLDTSLISPSSAASSDGHAYPDMHNTPNTIPSHRIQRLPLPATHTTTYATRQKPPDSPLSMPFPTSYAYANIHNTTNTTPPRHTQRHPTQPRMPPRTQPVRNHRISPLPCRSPPATHATAYATVYMPGSAPRQDSAPRQGHPQ